MDLLSTVRKSGSRGGVNFSWDEVANSNHRENYLGHSLKAPVGRWQKGKDLTWYAKGTADTSGPEGETDAERQERIRKEELRKVKEAEEDAMAAAMGLPPPVRDASGANAVEVGGQRDVGPAEKPAGQEGELSNRKRRHRDDDRRERRRHRSRSRSRDRRSHRRHRDRSQDREGRDSRRSRRDRSWSHEGRERRRRDRSREPSRRHRSRSRDHYQRSRSPRDRRR